MPAIGAFLKDSRDKLNDVSAKGREKAGKTTGGRIGGVTPGTTAEERENIVARPLSSLKDPTKFPPPPRRTVAGDSVASPSPGTPGQSTQPVQPVQQSYAPNGAQPAQPPSQPIYAQPPSQPVGQPAPYGQQYGQPAYQPGQAVYQQPGPPAFQPVQQQQYGQQQQYPPQQQQPQQQQQQPQQSQQQYAPPVAQYSPQAQQYTPPPPQQFAQQQQYSHGQQYTPAVEQPPAAQQQYFPPQPPPVQAVASPAAETATQQYAPPQNAAAPVTPQYAPVTSSQYAPPATPQYTTTSSQYAPATSQNPPSPPPPPQRASPAVSSPVPTNYYQQPGVAAYPQPGVPPAHTLADPGAPPGYSPADHSPRVYHPPAPQAVTPAPQSSTPVAVASEETPETKPKIPLPDPSSFPPPPVFGGFGGASIPPPTQRNASTASSASTHTLRPQSIAASSTTAPVDQKAPAKAPLPDPRSFAPPPQFGGPRPAGPPVRVSPSRGSPASETPVFHSSRSSRPSITDEPTAPAMPQRPQAEPVAPAKPQRPAAEPEFIEQAPLQPPRPNILSRSSVQSVSISVPEPTSDISVEPPADESEPTTLAARMNRLNFGGGVPNFAAQIAQRKSKPQNPDRNGASHVEVQQPTPVCPVVASQTSASSPQTLLAKKKPPPKPPKKKPGLLAHATGSSVASFASSASATSISEPGTPPPPPAPRNVSIRSDNEGAIASVPPPINHNTRPTAFNTTQIPKEYNFELETAWFTVPNGQLVLPKDLQGLSYTYTNSWQGNSKELKIALRDITDLSIIRAQLKWQATDPVATVTLTRYDVPKPRDLNFGELQSLNIKYGNQVAGWAEQHMGMQIGDGECWTLAKEAVDQGTQGQAMSPAQTNFGFLIFYTTGEALGRPIIQRDDIKRGDILQFTKAETRSPDGSSAKWGRPNHTAIVTQTFPGSYTFEIIQQNTGGVKRVQTGKLTIDHLVSGELKVYRVVDKAWAGELST